MPQRLASRLRVFVSSRMSELAPERKLVKEALDELKVDGWVFEEDAGARRESIEETFLEELEAADLYLGIFWKGFGPYTREEYDHAAKLEKDRLVYEKRASLDRREPELQEFLNGLGEVESGVTPRWFDSPEQLRELVKEDVAAWQTRTIRKRRAKHGLQISPFVAGLPSIPPPIRDFVGRSAELEELCRMVGEHGGAVIYGVRGLGGIGKTQLGLKLVELVGTDYPDGHILVELGGASDHPLTVADAMAQVIRAYEPQARLPEVKEELHRLYHQVLKKRRAIVLLDNAAGRQQVEPLLPHPDCLTLVTSRKRFALPKLHRLDLDALTLEAAEELLLGLAPRLGEEAERIAELLGRLPLALRLAGSAFAERPDLEPDEYLLRLEDRDERVSLVDALISFNYEAMQPKLRQRWRALAVFPRDFDVAGAAAVWAVEADAAKEVLGGALYPVSLVEWRGGRHRLHDLARDFATSRLDGEERQIAARRHAGHYLGVLGTAGHLYEAVGQNEGLALFDREWGNIEAGQAWAAAHADGDEEAAALCRNYSRTAIFCLSLRLHPGDRIRWIEVGHSAAAAGHPYSDASDLCNLGLAYLALGKVGIAMGLFEQSLVVARESRDRQGEGVVLLSLGTACAEQGEVERAIGYLEQATAISHGVGDWRNEGEALNNLSRAYAALGEVEKAIGYADQALAIALENSDRRGEGGALGSLGLAYAKVGKVKRAIGYHEQALVIDREIGNRRSESIALGNLGIAYSALGKAKKAIGYYEQALVIDRELGDRRGQGVALGNLGLAHAALGEVKKAIALLEEAIEIGRALEDARIVAPFSEQLEHLREVAKSRWRLYLPGVVRKLIGGSTEPS